MHLKYALQAPQRLFLIIVMVVFTAVWGMFPRLSIEAAGDTIIVMVTTSSDDGSCTTALSLRCAVAEANSNRASPTTIWFNFSHTIRVLSPLTISNPNQPITIDASSQNIDIDGGGTTSIFDIASNTIVYLNALMISDGVARHFPYNLGGVAGNDKGGGILNDGILTISNSMVVDNSVDDGYGGGLYNSAAARLTINDSTFYGNKATGSGGGMYNEGTLVISRSIFNQNSGGYQGGGLSNDNNGKVTIRDSTISNNQAQNGGGILNESTLAITSSTLSGNSGDMDGGGIANGGSLMISNSTLSGNEAGAGGGIFNDGKLTIGNSTLSGNSAAGGGGVFSNFRGTFNLLSTIVAGNLLSANGGPDVHTSDPDIHAIVATSLGNNLIGDGTGSSAFTDNLNADQVGSSAAPIDPKLGTLANNHGLTQTMSLLSGSPATGKGACVGNSIVNPNVPAVIIDQRGMARQLPCDIGAYESNSSAVTDIPYDPRYTVQITNNLTYGAQHFGSNWHQWW